ncbi:MAG: protein kinase domain-containing protein [Ktedonobacteraceae bacterium]
MSSFIFCDTCGAANQPNQTYCFSCGRALGAGAKKPSPVSAPTGMLAANTLLKQRYRILQTVGKGGMGAVYEAEDTQLGNRLVAVKEMSQQNLMPNEVPDAAENFKREAYILARLQHPNLPSIHDYFTEAGRWYLVMSFIQGETLQKYLAQQGGKLPAAEVLQIGIELCAVLDYLHTQKPPIIFRDLKLTNIMRTPDGHIYLIDFGIARHFKPGQAKDTAIFGSKGYAAPEQYGRSQTTPRSDIYSLGVILYQLLSGRNPTQTPFRFPSLHSQGIAVPADLDTLIMGMLDMNENNRPEDMHAVKGALQRITSPAVVAPTQLAPPPAAIHTTAAPPKPILPPTQAAPAQAAVAKAHNNRGKINWELIRFTVFGIILCGIITFWLDRGTFPTWFRFVVGNVPFRVSLFLVLDIVTLVIALFYGAKFGPWVGLLVGGVGTLVGDYIVFSSSKFGWNWDVRVALAGFIVGLLLRKAHAQPGRWRLNTMSALAVITGTAFASYTDLRLHDETFAIATSIFIVYTAMSIVGCWILLSLLWTLSTRAARSKGKP